MAMPAMKLVSNPQPGNMLTRGLASLLGGSPTFAPKDGPAAGPPRRQFIDLPPDQIRANAYQPRREFKPEALQELVASIRQSGVIQPVVVRRSGAGFELIAGERRLRAAKEAGLETVPAVVRDASEDEMLELALVENLQRDDLNALDLARAYAMFVSKFGLTHEEVAARLGVSRPAVANTLRLLDLPQAVQEMLASGKITAGHARAILSVDGAEARMALALRILEKGLSVRDAEYCSGNGETKRFPGGPRKAPARAAHLKPLETKLAERLGTRVRIIEGKRKGKIVVEFYSNDDFERILEVMGAA